MKLIFTKMILVFLDGELIRQIQYKSKREAMANYRHFLKHGIVNPDTGLTMENATFEMI